MCVRRHIQLLKRIIPLDVLELYCFCIGRTGTIIKVSSERCALGNGRVCATQLEYFIRVLRSGYCCTFLYAMATKQLIANELLAFVKHAIDYMDEVSILQICKSSFKEDEVCSAKLLLFQSLDQVGQMPSRRRDGGEKSLQDIIDLLKKTDPDDVPDFVAKELHKLPPVTFDHVDVTRLLKDITSLKVNLAEMKSKLESSDIVIGELRAEVALLRSAIPTSGSPDGSNINTRRGAQNASVCSFQSANESTSSAVKNAGVALCSADRVVPAGETTRVIGTSTPKRAYSATVAKTKPAVSQMKRQAEKPKGGKQSRSAASVANGAVLVHGRQDPPKNTFDEDGFIKVERKKRKPTYRNQCGTALAGPNTLLRPAVPTTQLYVSRLHHSTKTEDIVEYLRVKTNWTLRVEKLEARHSTNFKSFMVRVPTHHLMTFLKEEFWPKGVLYRRFRGQLRDTSQRNTTPALRVQ